MLGKLVAASTLSSSALADNRAPFNALKSSEGGAQQGVAALGDGQVTVSLSELAQSLLSGEDGTETAAFQSIQDLLGGDAEKAFGAFLSSALDKFAGGLSQLSSAVFALPIEDALVAAREATASLRQQLDGRGDLKAQFVSVVAGQASAAGAGGASAEASLQLRSVTIAFDDDTNAFQLSIDEVSISHRESVGHADAAALEAAGVPAAAAVAAAQAETTIAIKSFDYTRIEGAPAPEGGQSAPAPAFALPFGGLNPTDLLASVDDDALLPVPAELLRQLLSLPEKEDGEAAPAPSAAEPGEVAQNPAALAHRAPDAGLLIPGKLWKAINENILSVRSVRFDVSVQQSVAVALTAGSAANAAAATPARGANGATDIQA